MSLEEGLKVFNTSIVTPAMGQYLHAPPYLNKKVSESANIQGNLKENGHQNYLC